MCHHYTYRDERERIEEPADEESDPFDVEEPAEDVELLTDGGDEES
jgi:hypothetical protein